MADAGRSFAGSGTGDDTAPVEGLRTLAVHRRNWTVTLLDGVDHHPWLRCEELCRAALVQAMAQR